MSVLLHTATPIRSQLNEGNFRGEHRWERNVLEACIQQNLETFVTNSCNISSNFNYPLSFRGNINSTFNGENSLFISHGSPFNPHVLDSSIKCNYHISQWFNLPTDGAKHILNEFIKERKNVVFTTNFRSGNYLQCLENLFPGRCYHIQGPAVPFVDYAAQNFNKKQFFWAYRDAIQLFAERSTKLLFEWMREQFQKDSELKLVVLLGLNEKDLLGKWNFSGISSIYETYNALAPIKDFKDRVIFKDEAHWYEVLDIYRETKLIVSPPRRLGGPPYEASMFGIPIILDKTINPFQDEHGNTFFPEVLRSDPMITPDFISKLDKLHKDQSVYEHHGNAYRNYVDKNATYSAYINNIQALCTNLNWQIEWNKHG